MNNGTTTVQNDQSRLDELAEILGGGTDGDEDTSVPQQEKAPAPKPAPDPCEEGGSCG